MDQDTELFVHAFWVKCREVIRPEIDARIGDLRRAGHDANVSTQEFSETAERLPAPAGPSLRLAIRPVDAGNHSPRLALDRARNALRIELEPGLAATSVQLRRPDGSLAKSVSFPTSSLAASRGVDLAGLPAGLYLASLEIEGQPVSGAKVFLDR